MLRGKPIQLLPEGPSLPAARILAALTRERFEPRRSAEAVARLAARHALPEEWFDLDAARAGGVLASETLLFGLYGPSRDWTWLHGDRSGWERERLPEERVVAVGELVRAAARPAGADAFAALATGLLGARAGPLLAPTDSPDRFGRWPTAREAGIHRREHASLLLRSSTTTLVTDPQALQTGWSTHHRCLPSEPEPAEVDGVLLTHGHSDHWHLPSILHAARDAAVPVVVPRVPRTSLLCPEDFARCLRAAGQRVLAPAWWTSVEIGDFRVDVLPFFGEQPLRDSPGVPAGARNWGSCYRVTCPQYSVLILADSGRDPAGSALEAVERSVARDGPVDFVASCCFEFPEGINPGLARYALAAPLETLHAMAVGTLTRGSVTLGPQGVASVCRAARAAELLPYAHGFRGIGADPSSAEGGPRSEFAALADVRAALRGGNTRVSDWRPGGAVRPRPRRGLLARR